MAIPTGSEHYKAGKVEPLELIEAQELSFHVGNIVKYVVRMEYYVKFRAGVPEGVECQKAAEEAYEKALWYLQRYKEVYIDGQRDRTT
jgi:hypothetical protein